jgi:hypothetical protein
MQFRLRDLDPAKKLAPQLRLELLARVLPRTEIDAVLTQCGLRTARVRKVTLEATVWLVITMALYAEHALPEVFAQLAHGLRLLWPDDDERRDLLPSKAALAQRRRQLGAKPLQRLFARIARPLADPPTPTSPGTPGAFLHGLRWVALDGHVQDLPDTPANVRAFGRPSGSRGDSAFPQVRCLSLCECGTHAFFDVVFVPSTQGEDRAAQRLLRSLQAGQLLTADAGLYSYELLEKVREKEAEALVRLPATVRVRDGQRLPDGSLLVRLTPSDRTRRRHGAHQWVRILEYTFTDPRCPGHGSTYRLVTTLLDHRRFPAAELATGYHERWEIELAIDETDTHLLEQHQPSSPLRSRTPAGVCQELYGLFLMHYLLRALIYAAAVEAEVEPLRVSFTHAIRVVQVSLGDFEIAAPALLPGLFRRLFQDLVRPLLPPRTPRHQPRVVKRKVVKWPLKRCEHQHWPPLTQPFVASIQVLGQPLAVLK